MKKAMLPRPLALLRKPFLSQRGGAGVVVVCLWVQAISAHHGLALSPTTTQTGTKTTLTAYQNSSVYGECASFSATVSSGSNVPPNGESLTFLSGNKVLGTGTLYSGSTSFYTAALPAGTESVMAVYGGDASFAGSTSNAVSLVVAKGATRTVLTSSEDPSTLGRPITLTASTATTAEACWEITGSTPNGVGGTTTGTVTFKAGSTKLGTGTLSDGTASIATLALPLGANSVTAVYSGDLNCAGSTSTPVSQTVVGNATPTFTRFDAPGAGAGSLQGTAAIGIDAAGDVTGTYLDAKGVAHGFLREANGTILTFSAPGAGTAAGPNKNYDFSPYFQGTIPVGINTAKEIAGTYIDGNYNYHGFVRAANGQITPFDVTGDIMVSPYEQAMGTRPIGINAAGEIVGTYMDPNGQYHGFVRASNGQITPFDALSSETGVWTLPSGIDATGKIAGTYIDANGAHGFIRDIGGGITPVDVEGAGGSANLWQLAGTVAIGINAGGEVAGAYTDAIPDDYSSVRHGFVRAADGTITTFNAPGAGSGVLVGIGGGELAGTAGVGINAAGEIAGAYLDADAVYHGFLRAASGSMTTFDVPGAGAGPVQGTIATSVNDAGVVTGSYLDANYTAHGFILNSELTPTTIQLSFTPNPSLYWEPVTLTAKVEATSAGAMPPNGDIVTFMYAAKALGTGRLNGGEASFTTTALPVGKDSITAVYGGNAVMSLAGSTSNAVTEPVGRAKSYITFTSNPNPSSVSQPVTFIATVQGQFGGKATGAVTFSDGKTVLKSVALTGGSAKIATSSLTLGTHSITATYGGDTNFTGSSDSMTQTVN